jgi:hypothetical protein
VQQKLKNVIITFILWSSDFLLRIKIKNFPNQKYVCVCKACCDTLDKWISFKCLADLICVSEVVEKVKGYYCL